MPKDLLNKLNNLDYSDTHLDIVKHYLKTGRIPADFTYQQKYSFKKNYQDFILKNKKLYYKPLMLEAISSSQVDTTLQAYYDYPVNGLGAGFRSFYDKICTRFIGITLFNLTLITFTNNKP